MLYRKPRISRRGGHGVRITEQLTPLASLGREPLPTCPHSGPFPYPTDEEILLLTYQPPPASSALPLVARWTAPTRSYHRHTVPLWRSAAKSDVTRHYVRPPSQAAAAAGGLRMPSRRSRRCVSYRRGAMLLYNLDPAFAMSPLPARVIRARKIIVRRDRQWQKRDL